MISIYCSKCGNYAEVSYIERLSKFKVRYYLYCFECDREFTKVVNELE